MLTKLLHGTMSTMLPSSRSTSARLLLTPPRPSLSTLTSSAPRPTKSSSSRCAPTSRQSVAPPLSVLVLSLRLRPPLSNQLQQFPLIIPMPKTRQSPPRPLPTLVFLPRHSLKPHSLVVLITISMRMTVRTLLPSSSPLSVQSFSQEPSASLCGVTSVVPQA